MKNLAVIGIGQAFHRCLYPGLTALSDSVKAKYLIDVDTDRIPIVDDAIPLSINNIQKAVEDSEVDGWVISSPFGFHLDHVKMIAGTQKPMMIEKPIAADVAETQEVYKLVSEDQILVGYMRHFAKTFQNFLTEMQEWESQYGESDPIEKIIFYHTEGEPFDPAFKATTGKPFLDAGSHYFDMGLRAIQSSPVSAKSMKWVWDQRCKQYNIYDCCSTDITMKNGVLLRVTLIRHEDFAGGGEQYIAMSRSGHIVSRQKVPVYNNPIDVANGLPKFRSWADVNEEAFVTRLAHFMDIVSGRDKTSTPKSHVLSTVAMCDAVDLSVETGETVPIPQF